MTDCIFCNQIPDQAILYQSPYFKVVFDINPIQTGHLLIMSKEHYTSLSQLPRPALHDLIELEAELTGLLEEILPINGVTLARNDKDLMDAGTHFHSHLIPRIKGDGFWDKLDLEIQDFDLQTLKKQVKHLRRNHDSNQT